MNQFQLKNSISTGGSAAHELADEARAIRTAAGFGGALGEGASWRSTPGQAAIEQRQRKSSTLPVVIVATVGRFNCTVTKS